MLEFDYWRKYPYEMDKKGYALVVSEWPPYEWMDTNLYKQPHFLKDDISGEMEHRGEIIRTRSCRIDDDRFLIGFDDKRNYDLVLKNFPELVLEKDPFGPDLCPKCKKTIKTQSYWKRLRNAFLGR